MRLFRVVALAALAAMAWGCKVETGAGGIGGSLDPASDEVEYFNSAPEFNLARERAALKAEMEEADRDESARRNVNTP